MKKSSLIERVEELGAGIFVQERNMLSRLDQNSVHRAFSEKVIVWFEPYGYQEENLDEVLDAVAKLPSIWSFRFPNVKVPSRILSRIRSEFPNAHIY